MGEAPSLHREGDAGYPDSYPHFSPLVRGLLAWVASGDSGADRCRPLHLSPDRHALLERIGKNRSLVHFFVLGASLSLAQALISTGAADWFARSLAQAIAQFQSYAQAVSC